MAIIARSMKVSSLANEGEQITELGVYVVSIQHSLACHVLLVNRFPLINLF